MKLSKTFATGILAVAILLAIGCSNSANEAVIMAEIPEDAEQRRNAKSSHFIWGIFIFGFDQATVEITAIPLRTAAPHYNITDWLLPPACDDCFLIVVNSFDPVTRILDVDITLRNPNELTGYDVRGILYTNDYGHELRNADAWTGLWDTPGGMDINPFKAFAKSEPNRVFAGGAEHAENYLVYIPMPPHYNDITFAVDVSWPGNCHEPYEISSFIQETIYDQVGSSGNLHVDVMDWQGDVDGVTLEAPEISGEASTPFALEAGNTWVLELMNNTGATAGDYTVLVQATSSGSGELALYQYFELTVSEYNIDFNPVEIKPPDLTVSLYESCIDGNYLYAAGSEGFSFGVQNGLHIIDISDPLNTVCVCAVETPLHPFDLVVENGYAYIATGHNYEDMGQLCIVDVDPPGSASLIKTVDVPDNLWDVAVANGYAYVTPVDNTVVVIDIDPHADAHSLFTIDEITGGPRGVVINGDYLYVGRTSNGLEIVDIGDPLNPSVIDSVPIDVGTGVLEIKFSDDYAFVASGVLTVVDISTPGAFSVVDVIDFGNYYVWDIDISGDYAYLSSLTNLFYVVDIKQPESAYMAHYLTHPHGLLQRGVSVSGDYAYLSLYEHGIEIIDISEPESAEVVDSHWALNMVRNFEIDNGYGFASRYNTGGASYNFAFIVDIDPPETAHVCETGFGCYLGSCADMVTRDGYYYETTNDWVPHTSFLEISDIDPIDSIHEVATVEIPYYATYISVTEDYAFVVKRDQFPYHYDALCIVDINPPESANLVNTLELPFTPFSIVSAGGYVYLGCGINGLLVVDTDPPESASVVHTIDDMFAVIDVAANGDYLFLLHSPDPYENDALAIVDISTPESAYIINSVELPNDDAEFVRLHGGYAYVGDKHGFLYIIDINPVDTAWITESIEITGSLSDMKIVDNVAYISAEEKGLKIFELW